jgi:predicted secreted hydrolase
MNSKLLRTILILAGAALVLVAASLLLRRGEGQIQAEIVSASAPETSLNDTDGFTRAEAPRQLSFPQDHGPHADYQTEWWYYTGNLATADDRRFGYQLTFFRRALAPPEKRQERASSWGADQVYMAHFTLTNVAGGRFQAYERLSRGAAGLAGAQFGPFRVWLEDWRVEEIGPDRYRLYAAQDGISLELNLMDAKGPILQGDRGYSRKGPEPGNASYYYSLTRLQTDGNLQIGQDLFSVSGSSWMDHEYSTSALSAGQVGWDWFSIQLDDRSELMAFQIRREDGTVDPFSSGMYIAADGSTTPLTKEDMDIVVEGTWRSPHTGAEYPSRWKINIPSLNLTLTINPHLADQELNVSYSYWEGAVQVSGQRLGKAVSGNGYVELTGYAQSMTAKF